MIGVDAHLGGFDRDTLECQTPGGAVPPSCEAGDDGLTRAEREALAGHGAERGRKQVVMVTTLRRGCDSDGPRPARRRVSPRASP